jgi:hypothetical protein
MSVVMENGLAGPEARRLRFRRDYRQAMRLCKS